MLNVGGLVEYPCGPGGIVLANLLFKDTEEVPANALKKRSVLASILRNLGAPVRRRQDGDRRRDRPVRRSTSRNTPTSTAPTAAGSATPGSRSRTCPWANRSWRA